MEFDLFPLWISLKTAVLATIFAFVAEITAAGWMFRYQGKGKRIIDGIFLVFYQSKRHLATANR